MSDNLMMALLLMPHTISGASLIRKIPPRVIVPQLYVFQENPDLAQVRDKVDSVHLSLANSTAMRGAYFFEIRHGGEYLSPQLFMSEFIAGRQHVFSTYTLGVGRKFKSVSIFKNDITGEYYVLIFAHFTPLETNL